MYIFYIMLLFSLSPIPGIPIRGNDEQAMDGNVLSPNPGTPANTAWYNQRRMIYVRSIKGTVGHWPIPESFWPESTASRLVSSVLSFKSFSKILYNYPYFIIRTVTYDWVWHKKRPLDLHL